MNIRAQTGLNHAKQRQIEDFLSANRIDILHLQESHIEDNTFVDCNFISANYDIIANNSLNKFGTASLVKSDLEKVILLDFQNPSYNWIFQKCNLNTTPD